MSRDDWSASMDSPNTGDGAGERFTTGVKAKAEYRIEEGFRSGDGSISTGDDGHCGLLSVADPALQLGEVWPGGL